MAGSSLHRIEADGRRFVMDTETCFCFECDAISWDVLEHYPETSANRIVHELRGRHPEHEIEEVIGELEWLRSTKSILPLVRQKEQLEAFRQESGLERLDIHLVGARDPAALCDEGLMLLLGRRGKRDPVHLTIVPDDLDRMEEWLPDWSKRAFSRAALTGTKLVLTLAMAVSTDSAPTKVWAPHRLAVHIDLEDGAQLPAVLRGIGRGTALGFSKAAKLAPDCAGAPVTAWFTPGQAQFERAIDGLKKQGFKTIHIDLPNAYHGNPRLDPEEMTHALGRVAETYARNLLRKDYCRLEPVADLFHRIYEGKTRPRVDQSGTWALAIDGQGDIYPSALFLDEPAFCLGNLWRGQLDEDRRGQFDDLGIHTTVPCGTCWARNLCGGGHSAIHRALGGGIRTPNAAWCDAQRDWYRAAIAAFNLLSAEGVDFSRIYQGLRPGKRLSLWRIARKAMGMHLGLRPIEEGDAELLTRWENWSEAAYFLGNEYGMFLATQYDREMDSLHPRGFEQEFMIVSRRGAPLGLLKIRPERFPGIARIWVYVRDPKHLGDRAIRGSFARLLGEAAAAGEGHIKTLLCPVGPRDVGLSEFLEHAGFRGVGRERQAMFLHDQYHDLAIFRLDT